MKRSEMKAKQEARGWGPTAVEDFLQDMDEAGMPWDPESVELPKRLVAAPGIDCKPPFNAHLLPEAGEWADSDQQLAGYRAAADAYNRERAGESLHAVLADFLPWAVETFPQSTPQRCFAHLQREVAELAEDVTNPGEIADCVFLLLDLCQRARIDLPTALRQKLELAKARKWEEPGEQGVVEHVREPTPLPKWVRITGCRIPTFWYASYIGEIFEVRAETGKDYEVESSGIIGPLIEKSDCEPVEEPLPTADTEPSRSAPPGTFREICCACNLPSPVGFHVPDATWEACVPLRYRSKLCVQCFARFGDEAGVKWDESIELFPVSLVTHMAPFEAHRPFVRSAVGKEGA